MLRRIVRSLLAFGIAFVAGAGCAGAIQPPAWLPPLPHTVGMSGPDVDLIDLGIAAFERRNWRAARDDFWKALAIRSQTAIANFNLGVTDIALGDRAAGERSMRLGFRLANEHGMAASPQAASMRAIARSLGVDLR